MAWSRLYRQPSARKFSARINESRCGNSYAQRYSRLDPRFGIPVLQTELQGGVNAPTPPPPARAETLIMDLNRILTARSSNC